MNDTTQYLTVKQAARIAQVEPRTIYRWLRNNTLTRYRQLGDSGLDESRIDPAELGDLVSARAARAVPRKAQ